MWKDKPLQEIIWHNKLYIQKCRKMLWQYNILHCILMIYCENVKKKKYMTVLLIILYITTIANFGILFFSGYKKQNKKAVQKTVNSLI